MSDSDDTDILLLIPPNFFLTETHFNESPNYEMFRSNLEQRPIKSALSPRKFNKSANQSDSFHLSHSKDLLTTPPQFKYRPFNEASPSMNVSNFHRSSEPLNCISSNDAINAMYEESEKLVTNRRSSSPRRLNHTNIGPEFVSDRAGSLSSKKMSDWKTGGGAARHQDDLISLTNVWNNKFDLRSTTNQSTDLEEERLRRRQCERNIQLLQSQINQYQNKFTDVIKIDQAKNDTLSKLHNTNSRWEYFDLFLWTISLRKLIIDTKY